MKLLKDIRDVLADGVNKRPNDNRPDDGFDDGFDDDSFDDGADDDGSDDIKKKYNSLLLKHFQLRKKYERNKR